MTDVAENPYFVEVTGQVNGEPHTIAFDVREAEVRRQEATGQQVSEEELSISSLAIVTDLKRIHAGQVDRGQRAHKSFFRNLL